MFNRAIRGLPKEPVFQKGDANWIVFLPLKIEQNEKTLPYYTKLTPIHASPEKQWGICERKKIFYRKKIKLNFKIGELLITADLKETFWKRDPCNHSCLLHKITENFNVTSQVTKLIIYPKDIMKLYWKKNNINFEKKY